MTIEQERDIAVKVLTRIAHGYNVDSAYEAEKALAAMSAQASPVAQDERSELAMFQYWASCQTEQLTPIAAWKAGRASVAVPSAQPVGEAVAYVRASELAKLADNRVAGVGMMLSKNPADGRVALYTAPSVAQDQDAARWRMHLSLMAKHGHSTHDICETIDAVNSAIQAEVKS